MEESNQHSYPAVIFMNHSDDHGKIFLDVHWWQLYLGGNQRLSFFFFFFLICLFVCLFGFGFAILGFCFSCLFLCFFSFLN
jgi:hypothetical protein